MAAFHSEVRYWIQRQGQDKQAPVAQGQSLPKTNPKAQVPVEVKVNSQIPWR